MATTQTSARTDTDPHTPRAARHAVPSAHRHAHLAASRFHQLGSVVAARPTVVTIPPHTPASDALRLLDEHGLMQVPIVSGGRVLGIFSHRSFSRFLLRTCKDPRRNKGDIATLSAMECAEDPPYKPVTEEFPNCFDTVAEAGVIFVGGLDQLGGVVTAMDLLRHLHAEASPFLLIREIELSLRTLIDRAVGRDELALFARTSLVPEVYSSERMPRELENMSFGDCIALIGHGDNWPRFYRVFHSDRGQTRNRLDRGRELRNDIFHFRRELDEADRRTLVELRDWLRRTLAVADTLNW